MRGKMKDKEQEANEIKGQTDESRENEKLR